MMQSLRLYTKYTAKSYFNMLRNLLPKGFIWRILIGKVPTMIEDQPPGSPPHLDTIDLGEAWEDVSYASLEHTGSKLALLLFVIALEFSRLHQRIVDLKNESIPGLSQEMLDAWIKTLGLDTGLIPIPIDLEERQRFVQTEFTSGKSNPLLLDPDMSKDYYIKYASELGYSINISYSQTAFRVGDRVGNRLGGVGANFTWIVSGSYSETLQEIFELIKPAHTIIVWQ